MIENTVCYCMDTAALCDAALYQQALTQLPWQERRDAIARYRFAKDKRLSLGAGLLMQYALGLAGVRDLRLTYGAHGKPALADATQQVFINCSHSGTLAVCAVSDSEIGVDIEKIDTVDARVVRAVFTPEEQSRIGACAEEFYRLWTRKESYVKLLGDGIHLPLQRICVLADLDGCRFTEYAPDGYKLAVCGKPCTDLIFVNASDALRALLN